MLGTLQICDRQISEHCDRDGEALLAAPYRWLNTSPAIHIQSTQSLQGLCRSHVVAVTVYQETVSVNQHSIVPRD